MSEEQVERTDEERAEEEERKEAREQFALLLERLRGECERIDELSEWEDLVTEVDELLTTYHDVIPASRQRRIREAMALGEATLKGVKQACRVLELEVEQLIRYLRVGPGVATILTAGLIVIAAGVLIVTVVSFFRAVTISVHNEGCGPLPVAELNEGQSPVALDRGLLVVLSVELPDTIPEGDPPTLISVPPVLLQVDYQEEPGELTLRALGQALPLPLAGATAIEFDEESVLESGKEFDLRAASEHVLLIRCED